MRIHALLGLCLDAKCRDIAFHLFKRRNTRRAKPVHSAVRLFKRLLTETRRALVQYCCESDSESERSDFAATNTARQLECSNVFRAKQIVLYAKGLCKDLILCVILRSEVQRRLINPSGFQASIVQHDVVRYVYTYTSGDYVTKAQSFPL